MDLSVLPKNEELTETYDSITLFKECSHINSSLPYFVAVTDTFPTFCANAFTSSQMRGTNALLLSADR